MGQTPGDKSRPWTLNELQELRSLAPQGLAIAAAHLGRSRASVRRAAERHRISLRKDGSRKGIALGQPRGTSWRHPRAEALRESVIAGAVDVSDLEEQILRRRSRKPLCPRCAARPQSNPRTGLCNECHMLELAKAHRDGVYNSNAQRELWREKQRSKRKRDRAGTIDPAGKHARMVSPQQMRAIHGLGQELGITHDDLRSRASVDSMKELTYDEASLLLDDLQREHAAETAAVESTVWDKA